MEFSTFSGLSRSPSCSLFSIVKQVQQCCWQCDEAFVVERWILWYYHDAIVCIWIWNIPNQCDIYDEIVWWQLRETSEREQEIFTDNRIKRDIFYLFTENAKNRKSLAACCLTLSSAVYSTGNPTKHNITRRTSSMPKNFTHQNKLTRSLNDVIKFY